MNVDWASLAGLMLGIVIGVSLYIATHIWTLVVIVVVSVAWHVYSDCKNLFGNKQLGPREVRGA